MLSTTRALLLTDVVDSTKLSEALGDARMAQVWAAHDRVARDLLVAHRGREIDKTDGFLLLFEAAGDAAAYALAYHRAIGALDPPLRARAGLHVGDVILTENAPADVARGAKPLEVDGVAKPTAARVMSLALGGQTLLTPQAADALTLRRVEAVPDGAGPVGGEAVLLAHGHWMLQGLVAPVPLFELGVPGEAPMRPPPDARKVWRVTSRNGTWVPVREVKHGLPAERDTFVGREADLQDLARRLDEGTRLVSVLGIGGTGKTRLVTHYGWTWLGSWPGGAWFCDLSEARGVDGICGAVGRALDVPLGKDDPIVQLGHAISARGKCLVILDNFEQVARHAPETLGRWLDRASEAQFVVTTREVLGLPGETSLALAPLREDEAVALFVERAVQAKRDFVLTEAERPTVRELVGLLDDLPLAIELAAARVRVMPPKMLLQRMSERFKLLTSTGGRHTRQATLRATLDWSWEMLAPDEQLALAQLSAFEGGFTLEAAEAVLSLQEAWSADAVQSLVDKSLVLRVSDERFDLLVSVQEYAADKLDAAGGRAVAEARHGAHFATLGAVDALRALDTRGGAAQRQTIAHELENLVVACRRAVRRGDGSVAVPTFAAAARVLLLKGPFVPVAELGRQVLALAALGPAERARVGSATAVALQVLGRMDEALRLHQDALAGAREAGDRALEGNVLGGLGSLHVQQGRVDEALRHYQEALAIAREVGDRGAEGSLLGHLGNLHQEQGRLEEARRHHDEALAIQREVGDRVREGQTLANLGSLVRSQGRLEEALRHYQEALAIAREIGNRSGEVMVLVNLGNLYMNWGWSDDARRYYEEALALIREIGGRRLEGFVLGNLSSLVAGLGQMDESLRYGGESLAIHREVGNRFSAGLVLGNLGTTHLLEGRMDDALRCFQEALAIAREVGNRSHEGETLGLLGALHARQGRFDEARACFEPGEVLLRAQGSPMALIPFLCRRCDCERLAGDLPAARVYLAEAESLARQLAVGPDSIYGIRTAQLRALLDGDARAPVD